MVYMNTISELCVHILLILKHYSYKNKESREGHQLNIGVMNFNINPLAKFDVPTS